MNVLDENILESQRQLLRSWGIPVRQIGLELGHKGMADEEILPFLLTLPYPTLFTRDLGLAGRPFCHPKYGRVFRGRLIPHARDLRSLDSLQPWLSP